MSVVQSQFVRCSNCRRDYELMHAATGCPACGGATWVAAHIAERDALVPVLEAPARP